VGILQSVLNEEFSCSSVLGVFQKNTTVPSILFEKVLQSPAHLTRGAKFSDRAGITQLKSTALQHTHHIIQAPEVAADRLQNMRLKKTSPGKNKNHC